MSDGLEQYRGRLLAEATRRAQVTWEEAKGAEFEISEEALESALKDCSRLFLDPDGLSISKPLGDRLEGLEKALQKTRSVGYFPTSKHTDFDPAQDATRRFRDNEMFEKMVMREPDLRRMKYANKHQLLSLDLKRLECAALDDLIDEEITRTRASAEGWRYCLPKAALPFFAALHASRLGRNDIRVQSQFFSDFLDWLAARTPHASRSDLEQAAQKSEDQFALELQIDRERTSVSQDVERLNAETKIELARIEKEAATSSERAAELADRIRHLRLLIDLGGGLDGAGNVVLPEDQLAALGASSSAPEGQPVAEEPQLLEDSPEAAKARLVRSPTPCRTIREEPMSGYIFRGLSDPENFVPARSSFNVELVDLMSLPDETFDRVEIPEGCNSVVREQGYSPILGRAHGFMLPTYCFAEDYGKALGWGDPDVRQIHHFGSIFKPASSYPLAGLPKLLEAIRGVVTLNLRQLVSREPSHLLAEPVAFDEAVEDLTRYWLFILFGRHAMETFEQALGPCYFHGVHGPDFIIEDDRAKFVPGHFVITNTRRYLLEPVRDDAWFEKNGLAAGLRRRIRPFNG